MRVILSWTVGCWLLDHRLRWSFAWGPEEAFGAIENKGSNRNRVGDIETGVGDG